MDTDTKSFAAIYDEYAPKIYKFCYFRVSSKEEAEDLASQVFIRAWDHMASGKAVTNVQAFLYRIANNLVIDYYRKNKNKREVSIDNTDDPVEVADPLNMEELIDQQRGIADLHKTLEQLPDSYREVITLRYISDLTIPEIASVMGTSENNISVRLHRAVEKLKALTS